MTCGTNMRLDMCVDMVDHVAVGKGCSVGRQGFEKDGAVYTYAMFGMGIADGDGLWLVPR